MMQMCCCKPCSHWTGRLPARRSLAQPMVTSRWGWTFESQFYPLHFSFEKSKQEKKGTRHCSSGSRCACGGALLFDDREYSARQRPGDVRKAGAIGPQSVTIFYCRFEFAESEYQYTCHKGPSPPHAVPVFFCNPPTVFQFHPTPPPSPVRVGCALPPAARRRRSAPSIRRALPLPAVLGSTKRQWATGCIPTSLASAAIATPPLPLPLPRIPHLPAAFFAHGVGGQ
jgi:hypothetical protein